jgi:hypothetical protein
MCRKGRRQEKWILSISLGVGFFVVKEKKPLTLYLDTIGLE